MGFDFHGKNAVVTGGGSGIGAATVRLLRESGATVHVIDRETDVTNRAALAAAMDAAGALDVVVANAGIGTEAAFLETSEELWSRTLAVNLTGAFHTVQLAGERMKGRRCGAIVLTASTNSYDGEPMLVAYNASKAGVLGLLHTAANELGPYGIRVNAVCPGLIRTPLTERHFAEAGKLKDYFRHVPLGRGGRAEEVAAAIAFLASEEASYVSGAALVVDGGQMAGKFGVWGEEDAVWGDGEWRLL